MHQAMNRILTIHRVDNYEEVRRIEVNYFKELFSEHDKMKEGQR